MLWNKMLKITALCWSGSLVNHKKMSTHFEMWGAVVGPLYWYKKDIYIQGASVEALRQKTKMTVRLQKNWLVSLKLLETDKREKKCEYLLQWHPEEGGRESPGGTGQMFSLLSGFWKLALRPPPWCSGDKYTLTKNVIRVMMQWVAWSGSKK